MVDAFFQTPAAGLVGGTFEAENQFDGIACNDKHITMKLENGDSFIRFSSPKLSQWSRANTVELWFKIDDELLYTEDNMLLSVSDQGSSFPYY